MTIVVGGHEVRVRDMWSESCKVRIDRISDKRKRIDEVGGGRGSKLMTRQQSCSLSQTIAVSALGSLGFAQVIL